MVAMGLIAFLLVPVVCLIWCLCSNIDFIRNCPFYTKKLKGIITNA